jgi:hypothetical protein
MRVNRRGCPAKKSGRAAPPQDIDGPWIVRHCTKQNLWARAMERLDLVQIEPMHADARIPMHEYKFFNAPVPILSKIR